MFSFKPNIEKLTKNHDTEGLIKALSHKDENIRREAAIALGEYKEESVVEALITALQNTETALSSLIRIEKPEAIAPIVKMMGGWATSQKRNKVLFLCQHYGIENEVVKGIAQGLHFPDKYSKDKKIYEGKSVDGLLNKLPLAMERIPFLTKEQITLEYKYLKGSSGWESNTLLGDTPQGLQSGLVKEARKAIRKQLNADKAWLTSSKTSYQLISSGWDTLILTLYARGYVVLAYRTKLWHTRQDDGQELYFYFFSPERNW